MGRQRKSRRLMGLTPDTDIPEFYSCDDREKLLYIESNLRRVLRLRALMDEALRNAEESPKQSPPLNLVNHEGSLLTTNSRSVGVLLDSQGGEPRLEEPVTIVSESGPSSTSYGLIRRPKASKRVRIRCTKASKRIDDGASQSQGKRPRSVIVILDDDEEETTQG